MDNKLTVAFQLVGRSFDPTEVSDALGIESTESQVSDGNASNFWIFSTSRHGIVDINEVCHEIVDALMPKQSRIVELIEQYDLRAGLSLELETRPRTDREVMYGEYPLTGFRFDAEIIRFLSAVGAAIYVDHECDCEADRPA